MPENARPVTGDLAHDNSRLSVYWIVLLVEMAASDFRLNEANRVNLFIVQKHFEMHMRPGRTTG